MMVSRFLVISTAILLLGTVTFAQHQANPLVNDNGDSTPFFNSDNMAGFATKRNLLSGLIGNDHEKQGITPQPNIPTTPVASNQGTGGVATTEPKDSDEQAGDEVDAGDDRPDSPGRHEAKRSASSPFAIKPIAPKSATEPFAVRRDVQPQLEEEDDDLIDDDDDQEGIEEEDSRHEAKRELKARLRRIAKRDIDRFIMKTQLGVDMLNAKMSNFANKVGGGSDDTDKSTGPGGLNMPDGHSTDTKHATDAVDHAHSISSAAKKGDIKALREGH